MRKRYFGALSSRRPSSTQSRKEKNDESEEDKRKRKGLIRNSSSLVPSWRARCIGNLCRDRVFALLNLKIKVGVALMEYSILMFRACGRYRKQQSSMFLIIGMIILFFLFMLNTTSLLLKNKNFRRFNTSSGTILLHPKNNKKFPKVALFSFYNHGSKTTTTKTTTRAAAAAANATVGGNPPTRRQILHDYLEGDIYSPEFIIKEPSYTTSYYAFDDDDLRREDVVVGLHKYAIHYETPQQNKCTRTAFHRAYHPNCNLFHEIDMCFDPGDGYLSHGYYRSVWSYKTGDNESYVLKVPDFMEHKFNNELYEMIRMDALVMERLTSSPRIVNIYGHCATSVATEDMHEEIEFKIINGTGYATAKEIKKQERIVNDVSPRNTFTPTEKLILALKMTEAIADLHGFKDGVIVHNDIQLCQYLINYRGEMKLNDFNRAEVMLWDRETQDYCRYRSGTVYGNYRSAEENEDEPLNEQIDVFSLGNNFYGLLTGLWVFYKNTDDTVVQEKVNNATLPFIDNRYKYNRTFPERALVEAMEMCWKHDPDERASIFQVMKFLRNAVAKNAELLAN